MRQSILTFCFGLFVFCLNSQSIKLETNRDTVYLGNTVSVTISIENMDGDADLNDFSGIPVISGPNIAQSTTIVNGEISSIKSKTYTLMPDQAGMYSFGPITMYSGEEYQSNTIEIVVVDNPDGIIQEDVSPMNMFNFGGNNMDMFNMDISDFFNNPFMQPQNPITPPQKKDRKTKRKMKRL